MAKPVRQEPVSYTHLILTEYDKDSVTIETEDETRLTFERADIALIRLAFDF